MVPFDAPSTECETETEACSIRAALLERAEQIIGIRAGKASAFILDLDQHALETRGDAQRHAGMRPRKLECVLQQVSDDSGEHLSIRLYGHAIFDGQHGERDASLVGLQCRRRVEFLDEAATMICSWF